MANQVSKHEYHTIKDIICIGLNQDNIQCGSKAAAIRKYDDWTNLTYSNGKYFGYCIDCKEQAGKAEILQETIKQENKISNADKEKKAALKQVEKAEKEKAELQQKLAKLEQEKELATTKADKAELEKEKAFTKISELTKQVSDKKETKKDK